jgi:hypothetical protein
MRLQTANKGTVWCKGSGGSCQRCHENSQQEEVMGTVESRLDLHHHGSESQKSETEYVNVELCIIQ